MDLEGLEPSPVPWQGTVLPLHHRPTNPSFFNRYKDSGPYAAFVEAEFRFGTVRVATLRTLNGRIPQQSRVTSNLALHRPNSR